MLLRPVWPARLALVLVFLALNMASVTLWHQLEQDQLERVDERLNYEARNLARQLEATLHTEVESLGRIARLWNSLGRLPRNSWEHEAELALSDFPAYQSIQWTDANLQIRQLKFLSDQTTERKHDQRGTGHTDHTSNSSDGRRFLDDNAHQGRTIGAENTVRGEFTLAFVHSRRKHRQQHHQ